MPSSSSSSLRDMLFETWTDPYCLLMCCRTIEHYDRTKKWLDERKAKKIPQTEEAGTPDANETTQGKGGIQ